MNASWDLFKLSTLLPFPCSLEILTSFHDFKIIVILLVDIVFYVYFLEIIKFRRLSILDHLVYCWIVSSWKGIWNVVVGAQ